MGVQIPPRALICGIILVSKLVSKQPLGRLAQLVRAPRSHRGGQWFESTNDHHNTNYMKKSYFLLGVVVLIILSAFILRLIGSEDTWLCQNGQWVKHGEPESPAPSEGCLDKGKVGETNSNLVSEGEANGEASFFSEGLILSPKQNELITSPLVVQGKAVGSWFFEAVLPIQLVDDNGVVVASGQAIAEEDWMTEKPINFSGRLEFSSALVTTDTGVLVLAKDNPSGLPENGGAIKVPVRFR